MKNLILTLTLLLSYLSFGQSYYKEMNQIKKKLNKIENVEVLNIWGHDDVTLEEVSARVKIDNNGEIVLYGLSKDAYGYPNKIPITEIGGYSFKTFDCAGGMGPNIDIGTESEIFHLFNKEFNSEKDVIENYDFILEVVEGLKKSPEINHFETENSELFILVENKKSIDKDPINTLIGIEKKFKYAESLQWNNPKCYHYKK